MAKLLTREEIKSRSKHIFDKSDFVKSVYLFGSYARGDAKDSSDIDFMVVLGRDVGMEFFGLYEYLQDEFQKSVDVITKDEALRIMPKSIERDGILIYE